MNVWGKRYVHLIEEGCDGDCYAEDLIEVKRVDNGNDAVVTYT
jgi:hypothetical protein